MGKLSNRRKKNRRQLITIALVLLFGSIGWAQYKTWKAERALVSAVFVSPDNERSPQYLLEVASTQAERAKGLMFRRQLPGNRGMLFMFPYSSKQSFWMKNTLISLDMIFIDSDWKVVGILEKVPINNNKPRSVDVESLYAIELLAGSVAKNNIKVGARVEIKGVLPEPK